MFNTKSKNLHFAHFDIAGFSYWEGCMVMNQLKIGDEVQLVREENNKFDPYAVAIMFDGYKLGYIHVRITNSSAPLWIRDTQTSSKPASSASLLTATWNIKSA